MRVRVNVKFDDRRARELVSKAVSNGTQRAAQKTSVRAKANVVRAGRVDTASMMSAINAKEISNDGIRCTWRVSTGTPYSIYQERGVVGPIYPVRAKALRFKPKGASGYVFARSVKGFSGAHFMQNAYKALTIRDFLG